MKPDRASRDVLAVLALILFFGSVAKGDQVLQANQGQFLPIVVYVSPSDLHKNDFNSNMLRLQVSRIEFDNDGKPTLILGLNPKLERSVGGDLKITSPLDRLVAKDGVIEISLEGGHKLSLPIRPSLELRINNADFVLTPKPNGAGFKQAEKGKYVEIIVQVGREEAPKQLHIIKSLILEVTRIEWDKDGKTTAIFGVNPNLRQTVGKDLKITSPTDKLVAKNGVIDLALEGYEGRKLSLPMKFDQGCEIFNADWLLTQK